MEENTPPEQEEAVAPEPQMSAPAEPSFFATLKQRFTDPRTLMYLAFALLLAAAGAGLGWKFYLQPIRTVAVIRYNSHLGLMRLYDLQMAYHAANGTFANDLDTLLASAPNGAKLRETLSKSMDIETLAVIGDEDRFRLEANVLDQERTLVKIRGQRAER